MLIEGQDYHVHRVRFPNTKNWAAVVPNDDGSFDVYVNDAAGEEKAVEGFLHELRHISRGDLYGCLCAAVCERQTEERDLAV